MNSIATLRKTIVQKADVLGLVYVVKKKKNNCCRNN